MTRLLSIPQVAEALGCSEVTVYRLISAHGIPTVDIGTPRKPRTRVAEAELERFIAARTTTRAARPGIRRVS